MTGLDRKKIQHGLLIVVLVSVAIAIADYSGVLTLHERKTIDYRMHLTRMDKMLSDDIAVILIDEASLDSFREIAGRWPWPRYMHADLIDFLHQCGARLILMDILFAEYQLEGEAKPGILGYSDQRLVEATANAGNVAHAAHIVKDYADEYNEELLNKPMPDKFRSVFSYTASNGQSTGELNNYYLPFEELYQVAGDCGVVSFDHDSDGRFRHAELLFNYQGDTFSSYGLLPVLHQLDEPKIAYENRQLRLTGKSSEITIPLLPDDTYYVNMYGQYNAFSYSGVAVSMLMLAEGNTENLPVSPDAFKDKIVYVGASAAGANDLKNTAMAGDTPGVYLHASVCGNILDGDYLRFTGFAANYIPLFLMLLGIAGAILLLKNIGSHVLIPFGILGLYMGAAVWLFQYNIVLDVAGPFYGVLLVYIASFTYIGFTEGREKRKVRNILGQYVSPSILSAVMENSRDEYLKAEVGTKEYLTVFFSDIRDFTTISEKYEVEKVVTILNAYLSEMVTIIFDHSGTLDKFIGDAVVAFWGAPLRFDDHAIKAVTSALKMMENLETFNENNVGEGFPEIKVGIGIHTGDVILGNIGSEKKLDYTVIGDSVNLTSRLEGLTKFYGCSVIISEETHTHLEGKILTRMVDFVKVKGKQEPILIFEAIAESEKASDVNQTIAALTDKAFQYYRNRDFTSAQDDYQKILEIKPDDLLSHLFIERCSDYLSEPPEESWDGSHVLTAK